MEAPIEYYLHLLIINYKNIMRINFTQKKTYLQASGNQTAL